jgi:hypothetical protein
MEKAGDYMIRMIEKMYKEDIRSFCVKDKVVQEFTAYSDAWMPRSVCKLSHTRAHRLHKHTDTFVLPRDCTMSFLV